MTTHDSSSPTPTDTERALALQTDAQTPDRLVLRARDGRVLLTVAVTDDGLELSLGPGDVTLRADGVLALDAQQLRLRGRDSLSFESDGHAHLVARRSLTMRAEEQTLEATLGDVCIAANDDVKINGERVKLNS